MTLKVNSLSKSNFRNKFHLKQKEIALSEAQKDYIVNVIMAWIDREIKYTKIYKKF